MQRILIMGLPGSGKTTLALDLKKQLESAGKMVGWLNADKVREEYNDWDFSEAGRIRQAKRMREMADRFQHYDFVIADFVAPLVEMRNIYKADWIIWVDTIREGRYADTNKAFIEPTVYDFRINEQDSVKWSMFVSDHIIDNRRRPSFNWQKETVQMLGRWQPWHEGHRALFERAIAKTGQVVIQIRDCQGWQDSNPFEIAKVEAFIKRDLDPLYQGQYIIQVVPNIINITYGRDVGYKIEQESFDKSVTDISATKIRKDLGIE
jgi:adenylate kinase family enzyme